MYKIRNINPFNVKTRKHKEKYMEEPKFVANPHALFKDGVVTAVVYMQDFGPEEIAETLTKYDYDKVVRWEDYGSEIYDGYVEYEDAEGVYYAWPKPGKSWTWLKQIAVWKPPIEHPWDLEARTNVILNNLYDWDDELEDWVVTGIKECCKG